MEELAGRRAGQDGGGGDLVAWQDEAQGRVDQVGAGRLLDHLVDEVACESGRDRDASERGCGRRRRERILSEQQIGAGLGTSNSESSPLAEGSGSSPMASRPRIFCGARPATPWAPNNKGQHGEQGQRDQQGHQGLQRFASHPHLPNLLGPH